MYIFILYLSICLASIGSIRTKKTRRFIDKECVSVEDLVVANIGEHVQLLVTHNISDSNEWISGRIKSVKRSQQESDDETNDTVNAEVTNFGNIRSFRTLFLAKTYD